MNLGNFFQAKSIVIIGVSLDPNKIGHIIFRNFIDAKYDGKIHVVNPHTDKILGYKSYKSVLDIPEKIELAIIAVPADVSVKVAEECGKKGIRDVVMITAGFREVGNYKLDKKLERVLKKYKIRCVGPNCLGCYDAHTGLDTLFLPRSRLQRPGKGGISFICQSGAVGSATTDLAAKEGYGIAKFISYGNAMNVDESDLLEYLGDDKNTRVICMYIEGVKDGKKFLKTARKVSQKKPVIAIKGGITKEGSEAVISHTGALAGSVEVYFGAFRQAGIIKADSLQEMFNFARIFDKSVCACGPRIQVITNGGGYGILTTDGVIKNDLEMASPSSSTIKEMQKRHPRITTHNPIDLLGDATTQMYNDAIELCLNDKNIDALIVIVLYQTPKLGTDVVDTIVELSKQSKKPIITVSTGGEFTQLLKNEMEKNGIPSYTYPEEAVKSMKQLVEYCRGKGICR
ncbi:MAG: CoA-binding protein [Candidatus Aenigmarchaeota archaeon]|nr:CoA-binding protein [Candidatus Aenigmarchaeota archaeon]MDI6722589.1 CoA-binding protein [Candidatus Aenigmarchaeota archaeon]